MKSLPDIVGHTRHSQIDLEGDVGINRNDLSRCQRQILPRLRVEIDGNRNFPDRPWGTLIAESHTVSHIARHPGSIEARCKGVPAAEG